MDNWAVPEIAGSISFKLWALDALVCYTLRGLIKIQLLEGTKTSILIKN
jgi:hypothetical protein